ncbi:hypothetical protein AB0F17_41110 [Nonomuraea sp. NPDC026600]|uniref:hypothetical protein n=1 Tax=Nonomuraea sp. NPDC026600 TaxID=3155363 RepID=UPI0033D9E29B
MSRSTPANGTSACTSGIRTVQICRRIVTDANWERYVSGVYMRHLAFIQSDHAGDGQCNCTTTMPLN